MAPVLGYWNVRAAAEPIRMMLHYTGTDFEDKRYKILGTAPNFDASSWFSEKFSLGLDFPNIPYYVEDGVKISQSLAVMRYIARKNDLMGKTEEELLNQDMVEQVVNEFRWAIIKLAMNPDFEKAKEGHLKSLPEQLKQISEFLDNKPWLIGDRLTYVDFLLYEGIEQNRYLCPGLLDDFPNLKQFVERFENLPEIKTYMASDSFKRWPLYGPMAYFGGTPEPPF